MGFKEDTSLRDIDDTSLIEATCKACLHTWIESPTELLLKVDHRDVRLSEVESNLCCRRPGCRNVGVKVMLIKNEDTSGFVGGMP